MNVFAIYLNEPNTGVWEKVQAQWPGRHFIMDDRLAFVATEGLELTSDVAKAVRIAPGDDAISGFVTEVKSYFGFNRTDLWEWLDKATS